MKKTLLIIAIAGLAMTSCKKDRVCTCNFTVTQSSAGQTVSSSQTVEFTLVKTTKRTAKLACIHTKSTDNNTPNYTATQDSDCKLK
ncbi:MAG: hypothetical protein JWO32_1263 [Bacteroidetes bacterium]|nr:hypothetical protein [Bacteroidota bacterium]